MGLTVDTSKVVRRFTEMEERLRKLTREVGKELSAWQTEDMHRKRARTRVSLKGKQASTIIRPHSVYEMKRSKQAAQHGRGRTHTSTRPILRAELYVKLAERMRELFADVKW